MRTGLGGVTSGQDRSWQTYSVPDTAFTVELPAKLQKVMSFEGEHGASLEHGQEMKGGACYAAIETTPSESRFGIIVIKAEEAAKVKMSRAEAVAALKYAFLADDDEIQYLTKPFQVKTNGLTGREYFYINDRKGDFSLFTRGRIFDAGDRFFVLIFVGRTEEDLSSDDAKRFFNSFRKGKRRTK